MKTISIDQVVRERLFVQQLIKDGVEIHKEQKIPEFLKQKGYPFHIHYANERDDN